MRIMIVAGMLAALASLIVLVGCNTPHTKTSSKMHSIYLRDASGDCVRLYGYGMTIPTSVTMQHVESRECGDVMPNIFGR